MDPRRPSSRCARVRAATALVIGAGTAATVRVAAAGPARVLVVAAALLPLGLAACGPPTDPPSPPAAAAASERAMVAAEEASTAADLLDRLTAARTGRVSLVEATYLGVVATADAGPPAGNAPVMTSSVDAVFDRDAGVVQGRQATELHEGADEWVGEWASVIPEGGMAFELQITEGDGPGLVLGRLVEGDPLGGPVPGPWRDFVDLLDAADLDEDLHGADDLIDLLQSAIDSSPPEQAGDGRWAGSIPHDVLIASRPEDGPIVATAAVAYGLPPEVVGDALRYELADLGDGRIEAVMWIDVHDIARRLGEAMGGAPLTRLQVVWSELDRPVELWEIDPDEVVDLAGSPR